MSGVSNSALAGRTIFEIAFQVSPIILQNGIANFMGGYLPIVVLTEGLSVVNGLITGNLPSGLDEFFAQFTPLPGANLVRNSVGKYPFANQSVAANAIIREPKTLAMRMIAPARGDGGYLVKLATMTALRLAIEQHTALGGDVRRSHACGDIQPGAVTRYREHRFIRQPGSSGMAVAV